MKNVKTSLEKLSKESLIENLMLDSIKGGCCGGGMTNEISFTKTSLDGKAYGVDSDTDTEFDVENNNT